jgi:predicted phosphodiesterase
MKGIQKPELIVVSGDLVEGSKEDNADDCIRAQYVEVEGFLDKLVKYFLNGDRKRIVIVPGNHDYNVKVSGQSMEPSPVEMANNDYENFRAGDSSVRWSWKTRTFFHINDFELYATRFDLFKDFYNRFYDGIRELPEKIDQDSYIIELPTYNIAFVCFNSCYRLDHLNPIGCICPDAISKAHDRLIKLKYMGYLLVGVWHHHVSGLPVENNYMDYRILNAMIQEDIKMGLFGHQHVSTAVQEYSDITSDQNILLISSGSLYGNRYQLVTGVPRQYNVIELEFDEELIKLQLNVRKDISQYGYDIPQWQLSSIGIKDLPKYIHTLQIEKPQIEYIIEEIDELVKKTGNYEEACDRLFNIGFDNDMVLKYFDSYVSMINDVNVLKRLLQNPVTLPQYMTALDAAVSCKDSKWLKRLLNNEKYKDEKYPLVVELRRRAQQMV